MTRMGFGVTISVRRRNGGFRLGEERLGAFGDE